MQQLIFEKDKQLPKPMPETLKQAWQEMRTSNPQVRIRDAAAILGVSEAELLATDCGGSVTRLMGNWSNLLGELRALGPLMALTRNDYAVHEKTGLYTTLHKVGDRLLISGDNINLCLLLNHWYLGFAVTEDTHVGRRYSFQFFDHNGQAVHKIYLPDHGLLPVYLKLVNAFRSAYQSQAQGLSRSLPVSEPDSADGDLPELWQRILHCCKYSASERLTRPVTEIDRLWFQDLMHQLAQLTLPLRLVVKNHGAIQLHHGAIHNLKVTGPWFNVLDDGFNLHLNETAMVKLSAVSMPYRDGYLTGLELHDNRQQTIVAIFGGYDELYGEDPLWRDLVESLPAEQLAISSRRA
ncbi:MAG: ChuX/HutX family heme-like substrate-binding protein [Methylococcaceae bacterium]|nr:ChuX/HutX family heme-like substrate-binding protein [Methylococcaceae bacterium]MDZ4156449.1 ChuX/HutX family heme-like substrate-binding protein [Methylococcales bacterium]MDP2391665.1 ChuX/HutX family heme-like substrate-binding protein [Methylococcaceae bacterium]MDP3018164.1 ChuX/HutX family heme-like substrate-binding protein [Methylococcaceae bacterium]MDP3389377.1 ChuX/HutX family heme-like substrate-binding protein [Methylococcaceae bacterium]